MTKIFHYINFILIFLFLVGVCVLEDCLVNNALNRVQESIYRIEAYIDDKDSLLDAEVVRLVDNLEYQWDKDEQNLCYMVNHKSIQEIGTEIASLKASISVNDVDDFKIGLQHIDLYCKTYLHFMGSSLHNVL